MDTSYEETLFSLLRFCMLSVNYDSIRDSEIEFMCSIKLKISLLDAWLRGTCFIY